MIISRSMHAFAIGVSVEWLRFGFGRKWFTFSLAIVLRLLPSSISWYPWMHSMGRENFNDYTFHSSSQMELDRSLLAIIKYPSKGVGLGFTRHVEGCLIVPFHFATSSRV